MNKYKICPSCGTKNPPTVLECITCETDLTAVRAVDESSEKLQTEPSTDSKSGKIVRICDCGAKNLPSARKCSQCGEDLSDILPTPDQEETMHYRFVSEDGVYTYEMTENKIIIGRENIMKEYLTSKNYVSRNHAEITISDGKLYVKNLSKANGTYINNIKMDDDLHELCDGDKLSLGGCEVQGSRQTNAAYFLVRIGSCI